LKLRPGDLRIGKVLSLLLKFGSQIGRRALRFLGCPLERICSDL
jgi:hypothetical protein